MQLVNDVAADPRYVLPGGTERSRAELALPIMLAGKGLGLAWHNHDFEMVALADGNRPMDLLLEAAPKLGWEADIAWIVRGGQDPVAWLGRHPARRWPDSGRLYGLRAAAGARAYDERVLYA